MADHPFQIMTRRQAHARGEVRFYTGKPCKHGHVAYRYVSTGACITCLTQTFKRRISPWTKELEPYVTEQLWCPGTLKRDDRLIMRHYLQRCIFEFTRSRGKMTPGLEVAAAQIDARPPQLANPNLVD